MRVAVRHADILSPRPDVVLVPVSNNGRADRIGGAVGLQLARRFPEAWEECEDSADVPIPLGTAQMIDLDLLDERPCQAVVLLSCRSYDPSTRFAETASFMASALAQGLALARGLGVETVAAPVLRSGSRTPWTHAFTTMVGVIEEVPGQTVVEVRERIHERWVGLERLARTMRVEVLQAA